MWYYGLGLWIESSFKLLPRNQACQENQFLMILVPLGTLWLHFACYLNRAGSRGAILKCTRQIRDEPKGCREEQNGAERNLRGAKSKLKVAKREPKEPKGCQKLAKDSQRSLKGNQKGSQRAIKIHPNIDKNFMLKSMPPRRENG